VDFIEDPISVQDLFIGGAPTCLDKR